MLDHSELVGALTKRPPSFEVLVAWSFNGFDNSKWVGVQYYGK